MVSRSIPLEQIATEDNFNEVGYLACNPDVAQAVKAGSISSGQNHFENWGKHERRSLKISTAAQRDAKARKLERIRPILNTSLPFTETPNHFNFLSESLRDEFNIVDTDNVSAHPYDPSVMEIVNRYEHGLVLDVGAGKRTTYFDNVVNYEIVAYDSTDVVGVAEMLPFRDNSFDAVFTVAVLEHVKDPFRCALEMSRVLKPGGELLAVVPLLAPLHGYPHHYYNMTHQGLRNLFDHSLSIERQDVLPSTLPIWMLTWILRSWTEGLTGTTREAFSRLTVADLIDEPSKYMSQPFVTELSREKNLELATCTAVWARKKR